MLFGAGLAAGLEDFLSPAASFGRVDARRSRRTVGVSFDCGFACAVAGFGFRGTCLSGSTFEAGRACGFVADADGREDVRLGVCAVLAGFNAGDGEGDTLAFRLRKCLKSNGLSTSGSPSGSASVIPWLVSSLAPNCSYCLANFSLDVSHGVDVKLKLYADLIGSNVHDCVSGLKMRT